VRLSPGLSVGHQVHRSHPLTLPDRISAFELCANVKTMTLVVMLQVLHLVTSFPRGRTAPECDSSEQGEWISRAPWRIQWGLLTGWRACQYIYSQHPIYTAGQLAIKMSTRVCKKSRISYQMQCGPQSVSTRAVCPSTHVITVAGPR
jgi:hypothetical protein